MKAKLFLPCVCALCVIALAACAAPMPTATPVPPTPTVIPSTPTPTPLPPTPTSIPPTSAPALLTPIPRALPQATIRVGDLDRTYLYYIPANLPRNAPLLLALHGSSMDSAMMRSTTGYAFESLADQNGFIVVYPQGYQNSWNSCNKGIRLPAKIQNIDDVSFIRALIAKFRADFGVDTSRVFETGYSNGGQMGYRLALELPEEVAAVAAVAANLPTDDTNDCRASGKPISVLIMNGTNDPLVPFGGGPTFNGATVRSTQASAEYFAKLNGQTTPPKTTRLPHRDFSDPTSVDRMVWNDAGKPEVVLYTINGGGHVVPLGKFSDATLFMGVNLGQANGDLNAPAESWEFFARQRPLK